MRAKLFSKHGELRGVEVAVADDTTIGRGPENTVALEPKGISSKHARIFFDGEQGCYVLEDLGSLNGTELDSVRVRGPERLGHLHVITFAGAYDLVFQDLELCARRHGRSVEAVDREAPFSEATGIEKAPPVLPRALADSAAGESTSSEDTTERTGIEKAPVGMPSSLARATRPRESAEEAVRPGYSLLVTVPDGSELTFELKEGENLVGRASMARVSLDRLEVSRSHAVLTVSGDRVMLRDLGSANSTWVGSNMLEAKNEVEVGTHDTMRFGDVQARLVRS